MWRVLKKKDTSNNSITFFLSIQHLYTPFRSEIVTNENINRTHLNRRTSCSGKIKKNDIASCNTTKCMSCILTVKAKGTVQMSVEEKQKNPDYYGNDERAFEEEHWIATGFTMDWSLEVVLRI